MQNQIWPGRKAGKHYRTSPLRVAPATIPALAARAAEHYRRQAESSPDPVTIHVFPVLPSGKGAASDFRRHLAAALAHPGDLSAADWSYGASNNDAHRRNLETEAAGRGFNFVEIDAGDYQ